jgi:hypothetical protein
MASHGIVRGLTQSEASWAHMIVSDRYAWLMKSIGSPELLAILLVAMLNVYPLCRIARKMGYAGILGVLAFIPGINLILAYVLAFANWPVLHELESLRRRS